MKKILIALICALCAMCAKEACASDTTLTVGQIYDGGVIKDITVYESMAVIQKDGSALSLPMADDALNDNNNFPVGSLYDISRVGHRLVVHIQRLGLPMLHSLGFHIRHRWTFRWWRR